MTWAAVAAIYIAVAISNYIGGMNKFAEYDMHDTVRRRYIVMLSLLWFTIYIWRFVEWGMKKAVDE